MTPGIALAKQGLCEFCQQATQHGPWSDEQIAEVLADVGMELGDFADYCDDCFVIHVGRGDVAYAQKMLGRPLEPRSAALLAAHQKHEKFMAAGLALQDFRAKHPGTYRTHPDGVALFEEFLKYAPPEVLQAFHEKAVECSLLPEAKFVNEAGEVVYSIEQLAEKLGMPVEQVQEEFEGKLEMGTVHRLQ